MPIYLLDSNFFIQAHRFHYPFDVVPNFWTKVSDLAVRGLIRSIDKVQDELLDNKDLLSQWISSNLPPDFFEPCSSSTSQYSLVTAWAPTRTPRYSVAALNEFLDADEADAWLVAHGIAKSYVLVTHEKSEPLATRKIKIPDACLPFNIRYINTIEMFREIGETF